MSIARLLTLIEAEYLQSELSALNKHQLIDGEIYAMAGASEKHNIISGNIFAESYAQLKGKKFPPFIADMKVSKQGGFYYPDVMARVICRNCLSKATITSRETPTLLVDVVRFYCSCNNTKECRATFRTIQSFDGYRNLPTKSTAQMVAALLNNLPRHEQLELPNN